MLPLHYQFSQNSVLTLSVIMMPILKLMFGNVDFSKYPDSKGPFDVGYKTIRTERFGNEIHVYYPIQKLSDTEKRKYRPTFWLPHAYKTLMGTV